jgi:hypothetical protein
MAENKKSVLLYFDIIHTVRELSDDEAGRLFKHYLAYINDLNPTPPDKLTQIVFEPIKQNLKRDLVKWQSISEKRSELGRLAGIKSGQARRTKTNQNEPNVQFTNQTNQNEHVTVKDKVTVTDTVIVNDKDIVIKKESKEVFTKPTLLDCENIFIQKTAFNWTEYFAKSEAAIFFNFYESKDWMVGKNKMKNLNAAIGGWIARTNKNENTKPKSNTTNSLIENSNKIRPIF